MNNSHRTMIIAQGIAVYAALQNTNGARKETANWITWCQQRTDSEIAFVRQEQFNLFDRCNSKTDWS